MPRVSAKAVIVRDDQLLVIVKRDTGGEYYALPGGGQDDFETLPEAVRRECLEEIGVDVEVGELLCVRDYIARNHEFAAHQPEVHQVELLFSCRVAADCTPRVGEVPDDGQEGVAWLPLAALAAARLYPAALRLALAAPGRSGGYLGDVN